MTVRRTAFLAAYWLAITTAAAITATAAGVLAAAVVCLAGCVCSPGHRKGLR